MRRRTVVTSLMLLMGAVLAGPTAHAQDPSGTPSMVFELAPGVTVEALAFAIAAEEPVLYRLTLAAGASLDYQGNPANALELVSVETGTVQLTADAEVRVARMAGSASDGAVPPGTELTLAAGDYLVLPTSSGNVRNDGAETASLLVAAIPSKTPVDAPPSPQVMPSGSPAPTG